MGCSNVCTPSNFTQINQTYAGYPISSLKAGFGPYTSPSVQLAEHRQREKENERYRVSVEASTAEINLDHVAQAQQIADPTTSLVLAGAIIGTAVLGALTNMLAGKRANED